MSTKNINGQNTGRHVISPYPGKMANIKVFMYHQLSDDWDMCERNWLCLHVNIFRDHLKLLEQLGYTTITFEDYHLAAQGKLTLPRKPIILTFDDGYENVYKLAMPNLKEYGMKAVAFVLGERNLSCNIWDADKGYDSFRLLTGEQIREMADSVFEIGAHSMNHKNLVDLDNDARLKEIYESKKDLEMLIGRPVTAFSYPYGAVNDNIKEVVRKAGYDYACSVSTGSPAFGFDVFEIPRITVFNSTGYFQMAVKLATPYEYWVVLRRKIHLMFPGQTGQETGQASQVSKTRNGKPVNKSLNGVQH